MSIIYPLHFHRLFERHWATRMVGCRAATLSGITCTCGHRSRQFNLSGDGSFNEWHCSSCGRRWQMVGNQPVRRETEWRLEPTFAFEAALNNRRLVTFWRSLFAGGGRRVSHHRASHGISR
jgi:hypothetical protein